MGTLKKLKLAMKLDRDLRHTMLKGTRNEILIDLDGDKQADIALMDSVGDGDIDTIAVDMTGDGEFNLYLMDTDHNHIPDAIMMDEQGDGHLQVLAVGKEVEDAILAAANGVMNVIAMEEYVTKAMDQSLDELEKEIKHLRKQLK